MFKLCNLNISYPDIWTDQGMIEGLNGALFLHFIREVTNSKSGDKCFLWMVAPEERPEGYQNLQVYCIMNKGKQILYSYN